MTYIKKITMRGFKSFGDRTVTVKLSSGFTCIIGPNGAGKSNIIDALTFALGRLSKKSMRADTLEDLIFAGAKGKKPANKASVTLYFDNSENLFPGGGDTFQITRVVRKNKGNKYKMNGKIATRTQILTALASANIDPEGSNQFVLQGKIVELTHMNPIDRRVFIEDLIGLQKYDDMKEATMKELDKAERDLGQFEAIFKEVSKQLKKVEKEKNDALAWKELDDKIKQYNAQLIALKISKLQDEEDDLEKKIEESNKIIDELKEKITRQENLLKQETLVMEGIQNDINKKESEKEKINEQITTLKTQLSSKQTTLTHAKNTIEKLKQNKKQLKEQQMQLEEGQTYDSLIEGTQKEISDLKVEIKKTDKEIERKQQKQAEIEDQVKGEENEKAEFKAEISEVKQKISSNEARIKVLKENIRNNKNKKGKLEKEFEELKGEAEDIEQAKKEAQDKESKIKEKIETYKNQLSEESDKRKRLETRISEYQEDNAELNNKLSELKSLLSSQNTEISMNKDRISSLDEKESKIKQKIKDLSKGKDTEQALKDLLEKKATFSEEMNTLREDLKAEENEFRSNEKKFELAKMQYDSIDSEIKSNKNKINNIETELNLYQKELKELQREDKNLQLKFNALEDQITKRESKLNSHKKKQKNIKRRLEDLTFEKKRLLNRIERSEKEYEDNKEDIKGILEILKMLIQNINISVETIKGNIQQSNAAAIENSAEDFREFVLDIVDIMKPLENINCQDPDSDSLSMLNSSVQTLKLFTENTDSTIKQLIDKVKESSDMAVQNSTSNFDDFVQD
ncbi:MAG: AAA family ATPase, partial [Promethearchaeia archaeon]